MGGTLIEFPRRGASRERSSISQADLLELIALERHLEAARLRWMRKYREVEKALEDGLPVDRGIHTVALIQEKFAVSDWPEIRYTRMEVR